MNQPRHPYLDRLGPVIEPYALLGATAQALAAYAASGLDEDATLVECRRSEASREAVLLQVQLYPPQRPAADIRRTEELAVVFTGEVEHPALLAMRPDFPDTPHQNIMPEGLPRYPCVDDRPWNDAAPGWSPYAYLERVKWWLNAAAMGELTGTGQVVDPFFVALGPDLHVPARILAEPVNDSTFVLAAPEGLHEKDIRCLHLIESDGASTPAHHRFRALLLTAPISMARAISMPPSNLEELLRVAQAAGLDLLHSLQSWITRQPSSELVTRPALLLNFPVARPGTPEVRQDLVAVALKCSLGQLGTMLGVLSPDPGTPATWGRLIPVSPVSLHLLEAELLLSMAVQLEFDAVLARPLSGVACSATTKVLLVGAGAIGSHIAVTLTREGRHTWTVVDGDWLRPHNLARHVLSQRHVGHLKAPSLATMLSELARIPAGHIATDVLHPADHEAALHAAASEADVILDASASVAVARRLSDWTFTQSRRVSVFFNPAGTSAVLLAEDAARNIRLDTLEAQYYRLLLTDDTLAEHLAPPPEGFRYAGSCRAVSARIPESRVAVLSGLTASGISAALASEKASLCIWSMQPRGTITLAHATPSGVTREILLGWTVLLDDALRAEVAARRQAALPAETGGVLVGTVDNQRRVITLVDALPPPLDSQGSKSMFMRGVEGVEERLDEVTRRTGGMVRYVGEWHTHPKHSPAIPSATDIGQLVTLRQELRREGLPATMLIAGSDGQRVVLLTDPQ